MKKANTTRQRLITMSKVAKGLVDMGVYDKVNDALIGMYSEDMGVDDTPEDWATYNTWKKGGLVVIKGESGKTVWGKKRKYEVKDATENVDVDNKDDAKAMKFYPTATVFHRTQVQTPEVKVVTEQ